MADLRSIMRVVTPAAYLQPVYSLVATVPTQPQKQTLRGALVINFLPVSQYSLHFNCVNIHVSSHLLPLLDFLILKCNNIMANKITFFTCFFFHTVLAKWVRLGE